MKEMKDRKKLENKEFNERVSSCGYVIRTPLKPCPFCESLNILMHTCDLEDNDHKTGYFLRCADCESGSGGDTIPKDAVRRWNARSKKETDAVPE